MGGGGGEALAAASARHSEYTEEKFEARQKSNVSFIKHISRANTAKALYDYTRGESREILVRDRKSEKRTNGNLTRE